MNTDHPIQPIYEDAHGTLRFKGNAIVEYLLEVGRNHGADLNHLAVLPFDQNDREQFAQLIGYSLSGLSELSYVRDITYQTATIMAEGNSESESRIEVLEHKLEVVTNALRQIVPELFPIHPDDLRN